MKKRTLCHNFLSLLFVICLVLSLSIPAFAAPANGWKYKNGDWYYYNSGEMVTSQWKEDSSGWCYLGNDGKMITNQWQTDSTGWCYVDSYGHMITNRWQTDSHGWCYLGSDGHLLKNRWAKDSHGWCYLDSKGYLLKNGWAKDSHGWCYLDAMGYMVVNNWVQDNGQWFFCDASGHMVTGKYQINGNDYFFDSNGIWLPNADEAHGNNNQAGMKLAKFIKSNSMYNERDNTYTIDDYTEENYNVKWTHLTYHPDTKIITFKYEEYKLGYDTKNVFYFDYDINNCASTGKITCDLCRRSTLTVSVRLFADFDISTLKQGSELNYYTSTLGKYPIDDIDISAIKIAKLYTDNALVGWNNICQNANTTLHDLGFACLNV